VHVSHQVFALVSDLVDGMGLTYLTESTVHKSSLGKYGETKVSPCNILSIAVVQGPLYL